MLYKMWWLFSYNQWGHFRSQFADLFALSPFFFCDHNNNLCAHTRTQKRRALCLLLYKVTYIGPFFLLFLSLSLFQTFLLSFFLTGFLCSLCLSPSPSLSLLFICFLLSLWLLVILVLLSNKCLYTWIAMDTAFHLNKSNNSYNFSKHTWAIHRYQRQKYWCGHNRRRHRCYYHHRHAEVPGTHGRHRMKCQHRHNRILKQIITVTRSRWWLIQAMKKKH